jgi:mannonate dehydratase
MAMRVAVGQSPVATDEYLAFAAQLGASGVQFNTPDLPGEHRWEYEDIQRLVDRVAAFGLRVEAFENLPNHFYDKALLGLPGRDEQIEHVRATISHLGRAGVPILGLNFMLQSVWRTDLGPFGRGGATVSVYDHAVAVDPLRRDEIWVARRDRRIADAKDSWVRGAHLGAGVTIDHDRLWANYEYFVRAIVPTAEEAGIRIGFHPDDPPAAELHGVARILTSVDALERAATVVDSPALGVELCLGTVSEMGGEAAVLDAIARLGARGKICYVHLRDVVGTMPSFTECFLGEGNYSPLRVIEALHEVGFDGFILDDHTPGLVNDDGYGYRGRAHAIGYIQALVHAVTDGRRAR